MVVSARPDDMEHGASGFDALDSELEEKHITLAGAYRDFVGANRWGSLSAGTLLANAASWIAGNRTDSRHLQTAAEAFREADRRGAELCFATEGQIAAALAEAGLDGPRADIDVEGSVATGGLQTTGFTNDPVSASSGNFLEVEVDLGFGPTFRSLQLRRTYNSLDRSTGPFGVGWSSWASARLRLGAAGTVAHLRGPDGQVAKIPMPAGTTAGFEGRVEPDGNGGLAARFDREGTCWRFDPEGRPVEVDGGAGQRVRLSWDGGRLVQLDHERGRSLRLAWDGDRVVAAVADDGRQVSYRYDSAGHLVEVDGPMGRRRYECDARGLIVAVVDADGVVSARNAYDSARRVVRQETPFGRRVRFWYRPGLVTEIDDDGGGPQNRWVHDEQGRLTRVEDGHGHATTKAYDDRGNAILVTDRRGATTRYAWDERGNCTRIERPDGTAVDLTWDGRCRLVATTGPDGTARFTYQGEDRVPTTIEDAGGGITRNTVVDGLVTEVADADGVVVRFDHDEQGRVVAVTDGTGATRRCEWGATGQLTAVVSPLGHRTELTLDAAGRVEARSDPDGAVTRVERSPAGRVVAVVAPDGAHRELRRGAHGEVVEDVDALGGVTAYRWSAYGAVATMTLPDGAAWAFEHDGLRRVVASTDPAGAAWRREYGPEGNLVATVTPAGARRSTTVAATGDVEAVDDGLTTVHFVHDEAGRVVAQVRPDGSRVGCRYDRCSRIVAITEPGGATTRFEYSPAGRLVAAVGPTGSRTAYAYDPAGRLHQVVLPTGGRQRLRYDADGRLVRVVSPTGETTRYGYDACDRVTTVTDPTGGTTRYDYDPCGRLTTITDPTGGTTRYDYDPCGRLTTITDPTGGELRYERDPRGRVVAHTDQLGARTTIARDPMGRPTEVTDPLGRSTRYGYNPDGRLVLRVDPDGSRHWWRWDQTDTLTGWGVDLADGEVAAAEVRLRRDLLGRVTDVEQDGQLVITRRWHPGGALAEETTAAGTTRWQRDATGNVVTATLARTARPPVTVGYRRDQAGRPVVVDDPDLGRLRIARDLAGRPTSISGPGVHEERTWTDGRLTGWSRKVGDEDPVPIRYDRDPAGRITRRTDGHAVETSYRYDPAGQLAGIDGPAGSWRYAWGAGGRLTLETTPHGERAYRYDAAGQLQQVTTPAGATSFTWNAGGRRTTETGPGHHRRYGWTHYGRLATVTTTSADHTTTRQLTYDPLGRLATIDGTPIHWDPTAPLSRPGAIGDQRLAGAGSALLALVDGTTTTWLPATPHGEPHGLDPWGTPTPEGGTTGAPTAPDSGHGSYLGHRGELHLDGLELLGLRAYDPTTRTFLSPDPLPGRPGHPWAANPYHYAGNDPVGRADPTGLEPIGDAQLAQIRDSWNDNAWDRYEGYIIAGGLLVAGGAALLIPGVGPIVGGMIIGAALSGAISAGVQQATTGGVDYTRLGIDMALGAAGGGAGAGAAMATAGLRTAAGFGVRAGVDMGINTLGGIGSRAALGQNPFDPAQLGLDVLTGGVGTGVGTGVDALRSAGNPGLRQLEMTLSGGPGDAHGFLDGATGPAGSNPSGRVTIIGHGNYSPFFGTMTVPSGTTIHTHAPHGSNLTFNTALLIAADSLPANHPYQYTFGPGSGVPDYMIGPAPEVLRYLPLGIPHVTPTDVTFLHQLVTPDMGDCHLAFCMSELGVENPPIVHALPDPERNPYGL